MASLQPVHPAQLVTVDHDGRTALFPVPHIFASPVSYGNLPFGPRVAPPHTIQHHELSHLPPYAGPDLAAYRPTSVLSSGPLLPQVNLGGPFVPGFPTAPRVPSDFSAPGISDKGPQRSDFPRAGAPVAQSGVPSRQRQSQPRTTRHVQTSAFPRASFRSVPSVARPAAAREEEPRKRRVIVRFPPAGAATKRSPLSSKTRETIEQNAREDFAICVALAPDELVSRDRHFDEIRPSALPESLDVYLPGREAWQDVWEDMQESLRAEREAYDDRFPRHLRRHSHEEQRTDNSVWHTRAHTRATSLFSSASDLRSVVESLRQRAPGHRATPSMLQEMPLSYGTPYFGADVAFSTRAPPAFATISSNETPARSASCASNRTDVTGIASLSASASTAGEVDGLLRDQTPADGEPASATRDDFVMPYIHSDDSHYGDAEFTEPGEDAHDRAAEQPSPKRRHPRESTPPEPALELSDLAAAREASRTHDSRPLVSPASRQPSTPESDTISATAEISPLWTHGSASVFSAGQGEPRPLSVSPASPTDVYHQPPSPKRRLSATACDFVPGAFSSNLANPDTIAVTHAATELRSSQSRTGRRPLPPLPTAAPPKLVTESRSGRVRQLPQFDTGDRPYPALELIHPQPRRPLPATPMPISSPSPSPAHEMSATSSHRPFARMANDHEDSVNRSSLSLDDPLPEQYKPPRSVPCGRLVMPAIVPSGAQRAIATDFVESDLHEALLGRVTEASPARMGDPRALSALDTAFGRTRASASRRGNHPPVVSAEAGPPPSSDTLLVEHFEDLHAKIVSESAETRAVLALLADGLTAAVTKHESYIAEIKDVIVAQHSSLIDLLRALSLQIDAIPQAVSTQLEPDLPEKVILNSVRPLSEALPTILEGLHALRSLLEPRLPCAPLDDDLGTSASTLVKTVDLTDMLPAQAGERLATDVVRVSNDALDHFDSKSQTTKVKAALGAEKLAAQEDRPAQRHGENKTLGAALDAAVERANKSGGRPRSSCQTDLSFGGSQLPGSSGERLFAAVSVLDDSEDEPTDGTGSKVVFHGDVVTPYAGEEHAYPCDSDGWYSKKESQDEHAFL